MSRYKGTWRNRRERARRRTGHRFRGAGLATSTWRHPVKSLSVRRAAQRGVDELIACMPQFLEHAQALAASLRGLPGVRLLPDPPQTPRFHVHLSGDRNRLWPRMPDQAQAHGVWLANRPEPTVVPDVSKLELNIGDPALEISPAEAAQLFATVLAD